MSPPSPRPLRERQNHVLDVASELFYARGVHEVGMDELVRATGYGKATVYRMYPTKDALIAAYLQRRADRIYAIIDADITRHAGNPARAIRSIFKAVAADVAGEDFRGCAFNNASIEFADREHPARAVSRAYREGLVERLRELARAATPDRRAARDLADDLALVIDGMYTSAAHLGPGGPARRGAALARHLVDERTG